MLPDPVVQLLAYAVNAANTPAVGTLPTPSLPNPNPDLTSVPTLLYGNNYEFRVRLVDLTGGGPFASDLAVHPGPAPTTQTRFLRYVPPKTLEVVADPPNPSFPVTPPSPPQSAQFPPRRWCGQATRSLCRSRASNIQRPSLPAWIPPPSALQIWALSFRMHGAAAPQSAFPILT